MCSVVSSMWPVNADSIAIRAVSASRTSPTMITSGSARRIERNPVAKLSPALRCTPIWLMPSNRYSTGSSIVTMLRSAWFSSWSAAYRVVDLPEPVGPVTSIAPYGFLNAF